MSARPQSLAAQADSSAALRRELKRVEGEYERALRRQAPMAFGHSGGSCDEHVGRFCLIYDSGRSTPLPAEPPEIGKTRERAINAFLRGAVVWPGDTLVIAPLVRFLIEAGRPDDAVETAAGLPAPWGDLLRGMALHAAGKIPMSEAAFNRALAALDSTERRRALGARVLLAPSERRSYSRLTDDSLADYERKLWQLADVLYLTDGNEARTEHLARYVWSRILPMAPTVYGSVSWGWDLDELTRRFGAPVRRTRDFASGLSMETPITEHFHPEQLTYVPPDLSSVPLSTARVNAPWPYDTIRSRSGFAPPTVRAMRPLEHNAGRVWERGTLTLRVGAELPLDSLVERPALVEFGVFILDSAFAVIAQARDTVSTATARASARLSVAVPAEAFAYGVEARELASLQAARARHRFEEKAPARLHLSDLLLLERSSTAPPKDPSQAAFMPLTSLVLRADSVAVFLQVNGLTPNSEDRIRYRVDLQVGGQKPSAVGAALRRLGQTIGLAGAGRPRVTWAEEAPAAAVVPIGFNLGDLGLRPGLHVIAVTITDLVTSSTARTERWIRVR